MIVKSIALFYKDGRSDKEYNVFLEKVEDWIKDDSDQPNYLVKFSYGRRGSTLATGTKTPTPVPPKAAEKIYAKLIAEKTAKGYVPQEGEKPYSSSEHAGKESGLHPQLLNPISEEELEKYYTDPDWFFQEKLDGKRVMVRVDKGTVTASNRKGLIIDIPEVITKALSEMSDSVVDGEMIGEEYWVFDLLELEGKDLRSKGALTRLTLLLEELPVGNPALQLVYSGVGIQGRQQFRDLRDKIEGVVVKKKDAPYVPGRPHSGGSQLKCKFWESATVRVVSVNDKRSVVTATQEGTVVGNVTIPPNYDVPSVGQLIEVKYLYYYKNGALYQPIYKGIRDDKDEADTTESLKVKQGEEE